MDLILKNHIDYITRETEDLLSRYSMENYYFLDKKFNIKMVKYEGDSLIRLVIDCLNFTLDCNREGDRYSILVTFIRDHEFKKKHVGNKLVELLKHLGTSTLNKELISPLEWKLYTSTNLSEMFFDYKE